MRPEVVEPGARRRRVAGSRSTASAAASTACCSTAPTPPCCCARNVRAPSSGSRCRRPGGFADLRVGETVAFGFDPQRAVCFALSPRRPHWPVERLACAPMPKTSTASAAPCTLLLLLLLAPALLWLVGLIVLPHVDLAVLSLRARVAPRVYEWSLQQYRTFIDEPLYWHTFVRTAVMSIVATAATLLIAFPIAWYIAKIARGPREVAAVRAVPDPVLGQRDGAHAGLDDPAARIGRAAAPCWCDLGITAAPVELLYHDATILVGLVYTLAAVHGGAAGQRAGEPGRFADRGGLRPGRQRLRRSCARSSIPHAAPGIVAGSHRRVHADAWATT